jgi:hypothetical protein
MSWFEIRDAETGEVIRAMGRRPMGQSYEKSELTVENHKIMSKGSGETEQEYMYDEGYSVGVEHTKDLKKMNDAELDK